MSYSLSDRERPLIEGSGETIAKVQILDLVILRKRTKRVYVLTFTLLSQNDSKHQ